MAAAFSIRGGLKAKTMYMQATIFDVEMFSALSDYGAHPHYTRSEYSCLNTTNCRWVPSIVYTDIRCGFRRPAEMKSEKRIHDPGITGNISFSLP
jgi:hypothetical protein